MSHEGQENSTNVTFDTCATWTNRTPTSDPDEFLKRAIAYLGQAGEVTARPVKKTRPQLPLGDDVIAFKERAKRYISLGY